jgi:hypothetical protein
MTERRRHLLGTCALFRARGDRRRSHGGPAGMGTFPVDGPALANVPGPQRLQAVDGPAL